MKKTLELDDKTALKLYKTAAPEFRELLEQNFGKEFFEQKITDRINNYKDILEISGVDESADIVKIPGFDSAENEFVSNFIRTVRTKKVYNEGWLPKRGDKRWYPWYNVSSGFAFDDSGYNVTAACAASASRLCLKDRELTLDYVKKFKYLDEAFIDIR